MLITQIFQWEKTGTPTQVFLISKRKFSPLRYTALKDQL